MPKKIIYDEPEEDEEEEEVDDEDDEEYLEDIPKKTAKPRFNLPKPKAKEKPNPKPKEELETPKRRYVAFSTPQRVGIMDAETNEVIAEGEFALLQSNADILERLERIENLIGATME